MFALRQGLCPLAPRPGCRAASRHQHGRPDRGVDPSASQEPTRTGRPATGENQSRPGQALHNDKPDWESCGLTQPWPSDDARIETFLNDGEGLISAAKAETRPVNGVILQEHALKWGVFNALRNRLSAKQPKLAFVSAGALENGDGHPAAPGIVAPPPRCPFHQQPPGSGPRGVLLSLWSEHIRDQTLAGKRSNVRAWRYSSHAPLVPLAAPALPA